MRRIALLLISIAITTTQVFASGEYPKEAFGIMKDTATGKDVFYPTTIPLYRIDAGDVRVINDTEMLANLQLSNGITPVLILNSALGVLSGQTFESAQKLFGNPSFKGHSERVPSERLYTFNLKGISPNNEIDIFHIDLETGSNGQVKSYRVRGHGIARPQWQELGGNEKRE